MLTNEVDALVHGLAIQVARRYRTSAREDLLQQGRLWVLAHPLRMAEWLEADDTAAWGRMSAAITAELEAYARREKAAALGYALEDEAYYTVSLIEEMLPAVFDVDRELAPTLEKNEVKGPSDPAISAVWPAHLADVSAALDRSPMDSVSAAAIYARYEQGMTDQEIAADSLIPLDAVEPAIQRGLAAMVRYLGGERPRPCGRSCSECHGSLLTAV
jgi:DNA-directed RNA polymerase specialized sigma24 family protein